MLSIRRVQIHSELESARCTGSKSFSVRITQLALRIFAGLGPDLCRDRYAWGDRSLVFRLRIVYLGSSNRDHIRRRRRGQHNVTIRPPKLRSS